MSNKEAIMLQALCTIQLFADKSYPPDSKHLYESDIEAIRNVVRVALDSLTKGETS